MSDTVNPSPDTPGPKHPRFQWTTLALAALLLIGAICLVLYWLLIARHEETTEDAYVEGNAVMVTSQVSGIVTGILADTTDQVIAGQTLVRLNPVDAELALSRAEANLARTVRQVRAQFAAVSQTRAAITVRETEVSKAKADLARRMQLADSGAISGEEVNHARDALKSAVAQLDVAKGQFAGDHALVDATTLASHPDVLAAAAQLRDAYVARLRNDLPAPVGGIVTRRNVQVGQRVSAGTPLLSIVPMGELWVSANFQEAQLREIRVGQPVTLRADAYGDSVHFTGRVIGIDAGTGSAFSLLPAQNATGNWVKTIQRVPVRIALDPAVLRDSPLRVGLSMHVSVNIRDVHGPALTANSDTRQHYQTPVFDDELAHADALVASVIQRNAGPGVALR